MLTGDVSSIDGMFTDNPTPMIKYEVLGQQKNFAVQHYSPDEMATWRKSSGCFRRYARYEKHS
jgi:hypothetical protein